MDVLVVHIIHEPCVLNNAENTNEDDHLQFERHLPNLSSGSLK